MSFQCRVVIDYSWNHLSEQFAARSSHLATARAAHHSVRSHVTVVEWLDPVHEPVGPSSDDDPEVCANKSENDDVGKVQKHNDNCKSIFQILLILLFIFIILVVVELRDVAVGTDARDSVSIDVILSLTSVVSCASIVPIVLLVGIRTIIVCIGAVRQVAATVSNIWSRDVIIALSVVLVVFLVGRACLPELVEGGNDDDEDDNVNNDAYDQRVQEALADPVSSSKVVGLNPRQDPEESVKDGQEQNKFDENVPLLFGGA